MAENEFNIFETAIVRNSSEDTILVRLSSDSESTLRYVQPKRLTIEERFGSTSPIVVVEFIDANGDFVNHTKIDPETNFFLDIGSGYEDLSRINLKVSRINFTNRATGQSKEVNFSINFVYQNWNEMINKVYNRSWIDSRYSDVVGSIVQDNYPVVDIRPSDAIKESVIQPNWNNAGFIKWIRERAVPANDKRSHYEFGVKSTGEFFFKSIGDIIDDNIENVRNEELMTFRMIGQEQDNRKRTEEYKKNNPDGAKAPTYFAKYVGNERYLSGVVSGAGGLNTKYYDFDTGAYVSGIKSISNSTLIQLTDWTGLKKSNEVSNTMFYQGSNTEAFDMADNRVSDVMNSLQQFDIAIEGSPSIHIGNMTQVIIPRPPDVDTDIPISEFYSGFYIIAGVTHTVNLKKNTMGSVLSLSSSGFDGKQLEGYAKTLKGRFI